MNLPRELSQKIEIELNQYPLKNIQQAYEEMSYYYRKNRESINLSLNTPEKRCAYIAARMPATYAAVSKVLHEMSDSKNCQTLLDIGAGCGTASFACSEYFENLTHITAIEQNAEMLNIAKRLALYNPLLNIINWRNDNILSPSLLLPKADVVILSYSLNEIPKEQQKFLLEKLWKLVGQYLIIVEPGTQESFQIINSVRNWFLDLPKAILAPCPHAQTCPAMTQQDLCHFSTRVQRSSLHKYLKHGERGFEDEKFSYLILAKNSFMPYQARIVRSPNSRSGFISMKLCTENGFILKSYTKKDKVNYKLVKNLSWGDKITQLEMDDAMHQDQSNSD